MSVNTLTEADLQERENQYEKALMRSNKDAKKSKNAKKSSNKTTGSSTGNQAQQKDEVEDEDEDEQDAFDTFNPFGGSYK